MAFLLFGAAGCPDSGKSADTGPETATPDPEPPCADGTWGALDDPSTDWDTSGDDIGDPATAIHVRVDGDDSADGSIDAPVATLEAALALSRGRSSDKVIFVGPGTYGGVSLSIAQDPGDGSTDDGLVIAGCQDEVTLEARSDDEPIVKVTEAEGVKLYDLDLDGGRRALWIWSGASVSTTRLRIAGSRGTGVVMDGQDTRVDASDLRVSDTEEDESGLAIGVGIIKASARWSGGSVSRSRTAGVFVDSDGRSGDIELVGVVISETAADADGLYGRGLQVQGAASLSMVGCEVTDSEDAAVFVFQTFSTSIEDLVVSGVTASAIPDETETSGDGVVITSEDGGDDELDPSLFSVSLLNSTIGGYIRAGVLVEDVTATLSGNSATDGVYGLASQGGTVLGGTDTVETPAEELLLNREVLDSSALTAE